MASADVEGAFDCIKHDDVERALLQKGVHPESVCSRLRESCDLKGRINLPGAPMSLLCCMLVVLGRYWIMHSESLLVAGIRRELASCSPRTAVKPKRGAVVHLVRP